MDIIFTKDGIERHAYTPANAVQLRADGWVESPGIVEETVAETPAEVETADQTPSEYASLKATPDEAA